MEAGGGQLRIPGDVLGGGVKVGVGVAVAVMEDLVLGDYHCLPCVGAAAVHQGAGCCALVHHAVPLRVEVVSTVAAVLVLTDVVPHSLVTDGVTLPHNPELPLITLLLSHLSHHLSVQ